MNQRVKELWVAALRSGKYIQSYNRLRSPSGYCCLGVLCDIAASKTEVGGWVLTSNGWVFNTDDDYADDTLPDEVVEWAGLVDGNPDTSEFTLAYNNDHGKSFLEIADIIEREL